MLIARKEGVNFETDVKVLIPKKLPNEIIKTTINGNNVEYNSAEFELLEEGNVGLGEYAGFQYLHYVGDGGILLNPKGNISTYKMFSNFAPTKELDLSQFDTSGVVTMKGMFYDCDASLMIKGIDTFNTHSVKDMSQMFFKGWLRTSKLDLSNFNTQNVEDMSEMFYGCKFNEVVLESFITNRVKYMTGMFNNCDCLVALDLRNFRTSRVVSMDNMFSNCESLQQLNIRSFDTGRVRNMSWMLYNCVQLRNIDLRSFDTSEVEDMYSMFSGICVDVLDLSNFDLSSLGKNQGISEMFDDIEDTMIKHIWVSAVMYQLFLRHCPGYEDRLIPVGSNTYVVDVVQKQRRCGMSEKNIFSDLKDEGYSTVDIISAIYSDNPNSTLVSAYCGKIITPTLSKYVLSGDKSVGEVLDSFYKKYPKPLVDSCMCQVLRSHYIIES